MIKLTYHAIVTAKSKGFSPVDVLDVANRPASRYPSKNHPGQYRHTGRGLCCVISEDGLKVVTVYQDGIITPLRPEQLERGEHINRTH
jgi:hypothetical protein